MGIAWQAAKWLLWHSQSGVKFGDTLTLGRQNLYIPRHDRLEICQRFGVPSATSAEFIETDLEFAEPFFRMIGAKSVQSMDASTFENATFLHDLNQPIPQSMVNRFDVVYDGGTLEHVFNFPEALRSAMRMVKVGGCLFSHQCFNNMAGHGFYCFGPEVFFRALCEANGFRVLNARLYERYPRSPWYTVPDPELLKSRVRLISRSLEVEILVQAVKVADVPIFQKWPQQSDYAAMWQGEDASGRTSGGGPNDRAKLGVSTSGPLGRLKRAVLAPIRQKSLTSPGLGRLGKLWLNRRNLTIKAQPNVFKLSDPFIDGCKPVTL